MIFTTDNSWKTKWHNWFAWFPVVVETKGYKKKWAWLCNVKRIKIGGTWTSQGFIPSYNYKVK